jgi:hypothetical protein
MIEARRVLSSLWKAASTAFAHASTAPLPKVDDNHLMNIVAVSAQDRNVIDAQSRNDTP